MCAVPRGHLVSTYCVPGARVEQEQGQRDSVFFWVDEDSKLMSRSLRKTI